MKRFPIVVLITLLLLILAIPASAQGPVALSELDIKLWPEFDDPRLLVIIDGQLTESSPHINVPVPAGAFINAVASAADDGQLLNIPWESGTDANGNPVLILTPQTLHFRVEYYVPLTVQNEQRTIDFKIPPNSFSANAVSIEVLLPPDSTDVKLNPAADANQITPDRALLYGRNVGAVSADQVISQTISYRNPTGAMTMPETPKEPAVAAPTPAPVSNNPQQSAGGPDWMLIGLATAAVLLIAIGGYGLWRTSRPELEPEIIEPASRPRRKKSKKITAPRGKDQFCRNCGTPFLPDDRFCRKCGTKRR